MNQASTILIVDDEPAGRVVLEAILRNRGYHLAFADSGPAALAQAQVLLPDLILLDVMMPGMSGFEVCQRMRALPALAEVPIVILTALDDAQARLRGLEAGADDFLTKPIDRAELRARVQTITRLNRYRKLLNERQQMNWIIESSQDGYLLLDAVGAIRYANPQALLYLGLTEASGSFLSQASRLYRCEPEELWSEGLPLEQKGSEAPARYLVRGSSATAGALWLQVDLLPRDSADAGWLLRLRDVTPQTQSHRELRRFHAMIHHKFHTPLAHILGGLEVLMQEAATLSQEEVQEFADMTIRGAQRLHGTIEDILTFIGAPTIAHSGSGMPLSHLAGLIQDIGQRLELDSIQLTGVPEGAEQRLAFSPQALEWVLWEVFENAKKFHPTHTPRIEVTLYHPSEDKLGLRIADDGCTLSPEQLAHLWTPYYQGEKHFTGEVPGMGLGLPTVAALIWEVGGRCRIYNRDDMPGVVVEMHLPYATAGQLI